MAFNFNRYRLQQQRLNKRNITYAQRRMMQLFRVIASQDFIVNEPQVTKALIDIYQFIGVRTASNEYEQIRQREPIKAKPPTFFLTSWNTYFENEVRTQLASKVTEIAETTRKRIQDTLIASQNEGLLSSEIGKVLRAVVIDPKRALTIARTESTLANSMGKELSASQWANETAQELYKTWVHSGNRNERPSHVLAQGQAIPANASFNVGGESLRYPGDLSGSAANVINCGCTVVYVSKRFADRNFRS